LTVLIAYFGEMMSITYKQTVKIVKKLVNFEIKILYNFTINHT